MHKNAQKFEQKTHRKIPCDYTVTDAFSEMFGLEASPVEGLSWQQKIREGEKGRAKKL